MTETIRAQLEKLRHSITALEGQRGLLGDEVIDPALAALRGQLAALEQQAAREAAPAEERQMVTILFCDMVGSTSLAEKLDPEEWRQVVKKFHGALGEAVASHHGIIAQYLGDGLLAFFGAREAREHDPEDAIRAALDGQAAITDLLAAEKVQLRAGVHTGLVVTGELGEANHKEFTASGDAMNLAARLQSAAPPGGVLISHDTYRYVRGVFDLTPRPPLKVKGKSEPLQTYLVRRAKPRPFRRLARGVAGVEVRTIGREAEMQSLQEACLRAYQQRSTAWVQLMSEPGVGKSRLLDDLSEWLDLREDNVTLLRARAFADDANQPFALARRMWFDRFQLAEDAPLEQAQAKWVERFREYSHREDYEEPAHALGLLVGLPFHDSPHIKAMRNDPSQVKGRALVVSRELVEALRRQSPLLVLLEDLQWVDAASLEYLWYVFFESGRQEGMQGVFILGAARPEWQPPQELAALWTASGNEDPDAEKWGLQVPLLPLNEQDSRLLAREILQRAKEVPEEIIELIVSRAEGVPYYTEEIVNWFIDHGVLDTTCDPWRLFPAKLKEQPLPVTLQHLLLTRLSVLSPAERAALQRGAIFGRRFWTSGVEALGAPGGEQVLGHLQPRGLIEAQSQSAFQGDTEWSFQQNLLQEVTYESVLKRERLALHKVAALWLEEQARQSGRLDEFAGLLGDHYERAGELGTAAGWHLQAGRQAMRQGAPRQAVRSYSQALKLLPPVDQPRRWLALLGREQALSVLGEAEPWKADLDTLLEMAQAAEEDELLAEASYRMASHATRVGDDQLTVKSAREALEAAQRCGEEGIICKALAVLARGEVLLRNPAASNEHIEEALRRARLLGDENILSEVLDLAAFCFTEQARQDKWLPLYLEEIELAHRLGDRFREASALVNLGASYLGGGLYKQARSIIEQSLQISRAIGARRLMAYNLFNLGNIFEQTGDLRMALKYYEEGVPHGLTTGDMRGIAFSHDTLGHILLAMRDVPGALRHYTEMREIALSHAMPARLCEANSGLAACAVAQGQPEEARRYVQEAWDYLRENGWIGLGSPGMVYLTIIETFDALGEEATAHEILEEAHQALLEVAQDRFDPSWQQSFLENVPEHRAIMEMWERRKQ
jgi:class 3 adenylate cyclase/tetratricopeptide (TPR) repeat protein